MLATRRNKLIGLLYLAPALLFVLAFTAYPLAQMVWMSLNNWSLIEPPKFIGFGNFTRAFNDSQFWTSLGLHAQVHAAHHADPDDRRLPDRAAGRRPTRRIRRFTRAIVFVPVVIGLGASSLLWYWLFSPTFGLINRALIDLGLITKPVLWLGVDADTLDLGDHRLDRLEGDRLRHAAVRRRDPGDPARDQRGGHGRRRELLAAGARVITLPLTARDDPAGHADQRHRLAARLRPVLPHDRRPAAQPDGDLGVLHLPELVPLPEARLRRGAVADPRGHHPRLHRRADHAHPPEPGDEQRVDRGSAARPARPASAAGSTRVGSGRTEYLAAAICIALCTVMLLPLVLSVLASLKTTGGGGGHAADLLPARAQPRQLPAAVGLPGRACRPISSTASATALLTIAFSLVLTVPGGLRAGPLPDPGQGGRSSSSCCWR